MPCRLLAVIVAAGFALLGPVSALASHDPGDPDQQARSDARLLEVDDALVVSARAASAALDAAPIPPSLLGQVRLDLARRHAAYVYREAVRSEQADITRLAAGGDPEPVMRLLSPALREPVAGSVAALRALWRLGQVTEAGRTRLHRRPLETTPLALLRQFYSEADARYRVPWSYLASINYIESDFGRAAVESSAGALGPMQFMPATWAAYGHGDVHDPHDAILGAASYLARSGAPSDMPAALWRYNHDGDYVEAVSRLAGVIRADPTWLDRLYVWGTAG